MDKDPAGSTGEEKGPEAPVPPQTRFGRRAFLIGSSAGGFALFFGARMPGNPAEELERLAAILEPGQHRQKPDLTISAERDLDLVLLDFDFYGFKVDTTSKPPAIVPTKANNFMVVRFPPQAIAEAAFILDGTSFLYDPPPVLSVMAGPSQLVFTLDTSQSIPLHTMTVADLLNWTQWTLQVEPAAYVSPAKPPKGTAPGQFDTSIECPYGLYLAPVVFQFDYLGSYLTGERHAAGSAPSQPRNGGGTTQSTIYTFFLNRLEPLAAGPLRRFSECWFTELASVQKTTVTAAVAPDIAHNSIVGRIPLVSAFWTRDLGLAHHDATPTSPIVIDYAPQPPPP